MLANSQLPVVFLACVNSYQNSKRLRYLVHERKAIAKILSADPQNQVYHPVQKGNVANERVVDLLNHYQYHDRIRFVHFVGHAEEGGFRLESDELETTLSMEELSELIAMLPNLRAVFLSGCATPALLEMLLRRDLPAVIVTHTHERDPRAMAIARTFYHYLGEGRTLTETFQAVSAHHPEMQRVPVSYDIEHDDFCWEEKEALHYQAGLGWGMYYLKDNAYRLTERLRPRRILAFPESMGLQTRQDTILRRRRAVGFAATALLLGLLAVGITLWSQRPEIVAQMLPF